MNIRHPKPLGKAEEVIFIRSHLISARSCGEHVSHIISFNIEKNVKPGKTSEKMSFCLGKSCEEKRGKLILCH